MRSFFIFLCLIPIFAYSSEFDGVVRSNGQLHPVSIDKQNPSQMRFWQKYAEHGDAWVNSRTGQGRLGLPSGVMAPSTVPVTIQHKVDKKAVMNNIFSKVKTYAKSPVVGRAGWYGMAASIAIPYLLDEFFLDEEKGEFVSIVGSHFILFSNNVNHISGSSWGNYSTKQQWKDFCFTNSYTCQEISTSNAQSPIQVFYDYCNGKSTVYNGLTLYSEGAVHAGRCLAKDPRYPNNIGVTFGPIIQVVKIFQSSPLTYNDFERLTLPVAESNPTPWVNAARPYQNGPIAGGAVVASFSAPAGTSVTTDPYTDPIDGKAKQTTITINNDNRTARTSHMLRPDLDGQTDVAPVPEPLPENQMPVEENPAPQASAPTQCDKYPDSLGCQKMGDGSEAETIFDDITIPEIQNPTQFTLDSFMPDSGSCPAPTSYNTSHGSIIYSYEKHCDVAVMLRPFIIAFASLTALYLIFFRKA
ncbi:IgG-binding virulence factor TspB family protein [Vitreoscilla stercoraria]|uniref:TspB protein n=1 Tax=Vitreoscilla stercoraria TaxID=61 RepID=A0ABY4E7M4_VITST|nr:IgG-binding virulence factor TspB family protein [Vitreoscilla stercoraria]UOO91341.1 hypothetical protein LVJ81_06585 [Vitreoscilla stercoraria]